MKSKNIILTIAVLLFGLMMAGGTYAFLSIQANVTNTNYVGTSLCFLIDYDTSNGNNTQDITGTLFPTSSATGGLNGRVGLKTSASCNVDGFGTLRIHVNGSASTASHLTEIAVSHCEDKYTGEILSTYTTSSSCSAAGNVWKEYPASYCENNDTLQTLKNITTASDCTSNSGTWVTSASQKSPLKYAVYNTSSVTVSTIPISVGKILSSDIGSSDGVVIYDNFRVDSTQKYYYVYLWLDGHLTDNSHVDLPFSGYIEASATQTDTAPTP